MALKGSNTLREAEKAVRRRFDKDGIRQQFEYEPRKVIETERWWFIPSYWIGCAGFIVNKEDLYVNQLGSALTLEQCFWGHDHGVYCDLVDFEFAPDTDARLVARLLPRFKHMNPDKNGALPHEPVWYRQSELQGAISSQFPSFRRHFVWFAIPELLLAHRHDGLRFTCSLTKGDR